MPKIIQPEELKVLTPDENREEAFKRLVLPLMNQLKYVCEQNEFPLFMSICVDPNAKVSYKEGPTTRHLQNIDPIYEPMYKNDFVAPYDVFGEDAKNIKPDYIAECIKVINGWKTKLPTKDIIEEDEF